MFGDANDFYRLVPDERYAGAYQPIRDTPESRP